MRADTGGVIRAHGACIMCLMDKSLPVILPELEGQRFSCASCTRCCRDLVVHLFRSDIARIDQQNWGDALGDEPYVKLGKGFVLNKAGDGACVFLDSQGKCMIHAKFGFRAKPLACQLYPFTLRRSEDRWQSGVRFDCPSVARSQGRPLGSYRDDLGRIARAAAAGISPEPSVVELQRGVTASSQELGSVIQAMDQWMCGTQAAASDFEHRLRCTAFVTDMLCRAKLAKVRGERFAELVELLFSGAAMELEALPTKEGSPRARKLLRQLVFSYGQTSTLAQKRSGSLSKARLVWRQLLDSRRYRRGRGGVPRPSGAVTQTTFARVEAVNPASGDDADGIAELLTRYVRYRLKSETVCGSGYYGWPLFDGLQALWLALIVIAWRGRLEAAQAGRDQLIYEDVVEATGAVDRAAGRVPVLGAASERLRTRFLTSDGGFQRLLTSYPLIAS